MIVKAIKTIVIVFVLVVLAGGVIFGTDLVSYLRTSTSSMQKAVKESVPVEFELRRARDLVEQIIPEMHANIRLIAQEEVEVATLKADIARSGKSLDEENERISTMRDLLVSNKPQYRMGRHLYSHTELMEDLARRFDRFREGRLVFEGKKRLLAAREKSLKAAMKLLEKTRTQKGILQDKIEALEANYRLVKAEALGSPVHIDNSKIVQTEKLIAEIKKRLDVAQRVLEHEQRFIQPIELDSINEKDLLQEIDEYFKSPHPAEPNAAGSQFPAVPEKGKTTDNQPIQENPEQAAFMARVGGSV